MKLRVKRDIQLFNPELIIKAGSIYDITYKSTDGTLFYVHLEDGTDYPLSRKQIDLIDSFEETMEYIDW